MRHKKKGRKLGSSIAHTKAMKKNLVNSLFYYDRIKTIESRAKEIRPLVDKVVTWAKKGDLYSRRLAIAALGNDKDLVAEIFEKAKQGMFQDRQGGYSRIYKLGFRKGDNASMVIMELCTESFKATKATQNKKSSVAEVSAELDESKKSIKKSKDKNDDAEKPESKKDGTLKPVDKGAEEVPEVDEAKAKKTEAKDESSVESKEEPKEKPAKEIKTEGNKSDKTPKAENESDVAGTKSDKENKA